MGRAGATWCKCPEAPLNFFRLWARCEKVHLCTMALRHAYQRPFVVGVTGGIAAGKSTVCRMLSSMGVAVWDADCAAKSLYRTDHGLRDDVVGHFGVEVALRDDQGATVDIDRPALAKKVFGHPDKLAWLESRVHPAVVRAFDTWLDGQRTCTWVVREAAILFESGSDQGCDAVVTVEAPVALREARALRRGASPEDVARRMNVQWPSEDRIARAQATIWNDGVRPLLPQVEQLRDTVERWAAWRGQVD